MLEKIRIIFVTKIIFILFFTAFWSCNNILESSPEPGILRVSILSNPQDTSIIIKSDTFTVIQGDSFGVKFFQGKIYNGDNYALLYEKTNSYLTEDLIFNVIKRHNQSYEKVTIYETYVPPAKYDRLQIGITASEIRVSRVYTRYFYDAEGNVIGSKLDTITITNPVRLPEKAKPLMDFETEFEVNEKRITEVILQIDPFKSLQRFKDAYVFNRKINVNEIIYYE